MSGRRALLVTSLGLSGGAIAGRWLRACGPRG